MLPGRRGGHDDLPVEQFVDPAVVRSGVQVGEGGDLIEGNHRPLLSTNSNGTKPLSSRIRRCEMERGWGGAR